MLSLCAVAAAFLLIFLLRVLINFLVVKEIFKVLFLRNTFKKYCVPIDILSEKFDQLWRRREEPGRLQ